MNYAIYCKKFIMTVVIQILDAALCENFTHPSTHIKVSNHLITLTVVLGIYLHHGQLKLP